MKEFWDNFKWVFITITEPALLGTISGILVLAAIILALIALLLLILG
jgi:hypothetical protein